MICSLTDLRHICQRLNQFGHGRGTIYGGCSEYTIVPARYAYVLKTDIDDARACEWSKKVSHVKPWFSMERECRYVTIAAVTLH